MKKLFLCAVMVIFGCSFAPGQAQYKVLWNFGSYAGDGLFGNGSLVSDSTGNLYGTTEGCGTNNGGSVFELSPNSNGDWTESLLYSFCNYNSQCARVRE